MENAVSTRLEHDSLGSKTVDADAYYGIQTLRARDNFQLTGVPLHHYPRLVVALAMVKKACCQANGELGGLGPDLVNAISAACDDIIDGQLHDQFLVDMVQGGAGTSTNMNANEVIANRALELLGHERGSYDKLHPNNHVNLSQSTNDVYPTAIKLAIQLSCPELISALERISETLAVKAEEFSGVLKLGRTQLQDAVPMTLGQEFNACRTTLQEDISRLHEVAVLGREINLGATAIGTGINTDSRYADLAVAKLSAIAGMPFTLAPDLIEATSDTGAFVMLSGVLRRIAIKLSKFCNDLRLLSSGPRGGFGEINLPPVQPGSSIMPGKVNPVIPEAVNQVAYRVMGNDLSVSMAAEAGQLQLNAMEPLIVYSLLDSIQLMTRAIDMLEERCIRGISANTDHCLAVMNNSMALITALSPHLGYELTSKLAKQALETEASVRDLILENGIMSAEALDDILKPEKMLQPITATQP
ncbi:aspartate ammonia-lyase [Exilibacterium tricleocarpae]|uniref:Aspartate ammonia-lyase n=1 Tax=Exilibacterium tricleocarpae TaxID=2591008 RepID=A0A545SYZ0_9GAMM|nr:aspartate ammonia-lyase [Exilibacterium tricleocarpae]TQV70170.1 aspartate ammonia-lyase [Exilibacterium tricleocarpae]